jgi:hypothetical protein
MASMKGMAGSNFGLGRMVIFRSLGTASHPLQIPSRLIHLESGHPREKKIVSSLDESTRVAGEAEGTTLRASFKLQG